MTSFVAIIFEEGATMKLNLGVRTRMLALGVGLALLTSWSVANAAQSPGPAQWTLAVIEETTSVDAGTAAAANATVLVLRHLFEPLVAYEGAPFKLTPRLASSWTVKDDRWEFKLRQGVKHHDGTPVTAEDVKYSLNIYRQDGSPRKANTVGITNVEAVDAQTVRITTDGPRPGLMANLSLLLILPKRAREKMGADEFSKKPVGNGPYKFVEFVRGQRLVLEANPDYYRGRVQPSRLVLRPITDPATRVAELKTGGVQIIQDPSLAQLSELQNDPNTELKLLKGGRLIIHPFNTTEPPFDDVRVRRAANFAVDRASILKRVLENYGELLRGPYSSAWPGYDPKLNPYPYDPARAKRLLAEAGYRNGFDAGELTPNPPYFSLGEAVANYLGAIGIKLKLRTMERAAFQSARAAKQLRGLCICVSGRYGNAATRIEESVVSTGTFAYGGYADLDALFKQQDKETDRAKREAMLHQIQQLMHERVMFGPIWLYFWPSGIGPRVEDPALMAINPFPWSAPLEEVRLKKP
jgi:peptide/nickel transport system substrate-binding protein